MLKMKRIILWIVFLLLLFSKNVYAVYYDLSDEQIKQALEFGEKNKDMDNTAFLNEWMSLSNERYEWAALNTKFSILAYEAKQAALASKNLTKPQILQFMSEVEETLSFHVVLYGSSPDFACSYQAVLLYKNKPIRPILEHNDEHAKAANLGMRIPLIYRAMCRYDFPNYYIEPVAEVTLVIISPLNKERQFTFDLSKMR